MYNHETESNLQLKIVGYFLLGAFTFRINGFALPLGFLLFLLCFNPTKNRKIKQRSAYFGLAVFVVQLVTPAVGEYIYEYPRKVAGTSGDVYHLRFTQDWRAIQGQLQIDPQAHLEDFRAEYLKNGQLKRLSYDLVSHSEDGYIHYDIGFSPEKKEYRVRRHKVGYKWSRFDRTVEAERFFEVLDQVQVRTLSQKQAFEEYSMISDGELTFYGIKESRKYLIKGNEIKEITNSELPITGHYFISCGKGYEAASGITTTGCDSVVDYFFDVETTNQAQSE